MTSNYDVHSPPDIIISHCGKQWMCLFSSLDLDIIFFNISCYQSDLCKNCSTSGLIIVFSALIRTPRTTTASTPETFRNSSPVITNIMVY